jgi:hypothetical protein
MEGMTQPKYTQNEAKLRVWAEYPEAKEHRFGMIWCKGEYLGDSWEEVAASKLTPTAIGPEEIFPEPPRVKDKHRFMGGTCVDCGKPLDEICKANSAIPAQEAKSGWIDVNQELPPRSRVLVYFPSESTSVMDGLFDGKDFRVDGFVRTKAVTHWQPLPAPPEVKK